MTPNLRRPGCVALSAVRVLLCTIVAITALVASAGASHRDRDRDADLPAAGIFLEGIGVDKRAGVFYVSATNQSGALSRGSTRARDRPPSRGLADLVAPAGRGRGGASPSGVRLRPCRSKSSPHSASSRRPCWP